MSKVSMNSVEPGMVLNSPIYQADNQKLLLSAGAVLTQGMITQLQRLGLQSLDIADRFTRFVGPLEKMRHYLCGLYEKYIEIYTSEKEEENLCDDMVWAAKVTKQIVDEICADEKVLNLCMQMHIQDSNVLLDHSVLSSVFSGLLSGSVHFPVEQTKTVMLGALLQNVGALEMPHLIAQKDNLHGQDALLWQSHPEYGYYMAVQEGFSKEVAEIILTHHENWDGSGYPKQLVGEDIPLATRIVSVCGSLTNHLVYHKLQPYEALEYLYGTSNMYFDKRIVDLFATNVTLYPLGSLVRLTTGEVGVVTNIRQNKGPRPVVSVYFNRFHKPYTSPKRVDLAVERTIFISEIMDF